MNFVGKTREGSELVSSWKEPTCSLNSFDGRGRSGGVPLKRECSRKGSELVGGKNPLGHLSRWMDEGRGEVPLKRECSREGSELVSSWKEPTCSLKSLDGRGKGRGTTKKRVFEKTKNKCPKKIYS